MSSTALISQLENTKPNDDFYTTNSSVLNLSQSSKFTRFKENTYKFDINNESIYFCVDNFIEKTDKNKKYFSEIRKITVLKKESRSNKQTDGEQGHIDQAKAIGRAIDTGAKSIARSCCSGFTKGQLVVYYLVIFIILAIIAGVCIAILV